MTPNNNESIAQAFVAALFAADGPRDAFRDAVYAFNERFVAIVNATLPDTNITESDVAPLLALIAVEITEAASQAPTSGIALYNIMTHGPGPGPRPGP